MVAALLGAQTLFYKLPIEERKRFVSLNNEREKTGAMIHELGDKFIEVAKPSEGSIFIAGPEGAVHSEPPINRNRLFVAVIPCSKKQLDEMHNADMQATAPDFQERVAAEIQKMFPGAKNNR